MAAKISPANTRPVPFHHRLYGFGGVFGKTLRESRSPVLVVAGLVGGLLTLFGAFFADAYPTAAAREQLTDLVASLPPVLKGISYGSADPVRLDTLGGYVSQDPGLLLKLIPALWSILALSATLATETRRGSLDLVAVAPISRRRIAVEKLAAHVVAMAAVVSVVAVAAWLTGQAFASLPGDAIAPRAALGYALWLGLTGLLAGSIAFALAPVCGRATAAGVAGTLLFGGYVSNSYQASFPGFSGPARLTWFSWTAHHNPLIGAYDWRSLGLVALVTVVFSAAGVEAFARRELGPAARAGIRGFGAPIAMPGLRGPVGRTFGELLSAASAWGAGLGSYGLLIAASSRSLANQLGDTPDIAAKLASLFPTYDITSTGGVLQATFMTFASALSGLAAAALVARWASEETTGRLEIVLTSSLTRTRWAIGSGLGVYLALGLTTLVAVGGVATGTTVAGDNAAIPASATLALGIYALGLAGVGLAIGGLVGPAAAGPVVAGLAAATFLLDVLARPLKLPDPIHHLALTANFGQPMTGNWDWTGVAASLALALVGVALAGWAVRRRDLG